ncbi:unnamed protein product [Linum tenue]|uniref:Uncharacterized protein n=1 Tax=Linum tenue TaxID=586396 RepID=A0AAV0NSA0_9ROSI|nr:unnamed protein product [Linum tenue]
MVVALRPANFYGSSLPRPRFFDHTNDVTERFDPPVSVMDPLLSWAQEAHWSMGGLNTQRFRLQGRIEGNVDRLRKFREKQAKSQTGNTPKKQQNDVLPLAAGEKNHKRAGSTSPPPAPRVMKKRKFMDLFGDESKKWPVRKLVGEFERVAMETEAKKNEGKTQESVESVGVRTNSKKRLRKVGEDGQKIPADAGGNGGSVRTSPRFAKLKSS